MYNCHELIKIEVLIVSSYLIVTLFYFQPLKLHQYCNTNAIFPTWGEHLSTCITAYSLDLVYYRMLAL